MFKIHLSNLEVQFPQKSFSKMEAFLKFNPQTTKKESIVGPDRDKKQRKCENCCTYPEPVF